MMGLEDFLQARWSDREVGRPTSRTYFRMNGTEFKRGEYITVIGQDNYVGRRR